jgi:hypothetical protein
MDDSVIHNQPSTDKTVRGQPHILSEADRRHPLLRRGSDRSEETRDEARDRAPNRSGLFRRSGPSPHVDRIDGVATDQLRQQLPTRRRIVEQVEPHDVVTNGE